jgi:hypothetical protein
MITGEIKSQVDRVWDAFWSGGISNPMFSMSFSGPVNTAVGCKGKK